MTGLCRGESESCSRGDHRRQCLLCFWVCTPERAATVLPFMRTLNYAHYALILRGFCVCVTQSSCVAPGVTFQMQTWEKNKHVLSTVNASGVSDFGSGGISGCRKKTKVHLLQPKANIQKSLSP